MFNLGFFKGQPTEYVIKYVSGKVTGEGPGLAFIYFRHKTTVVAVPTGSTDANFVFNEVTNNFQDVTIQGQCTYRINNPNQAASLLNFAIDPRRRLPVSDEPERLPQRITNIIQMETRGEIQKRSLEETLRDSQMIATEVLRRIREAALLEPMGVELLSVYFLSAKPTPEVAKALEADYRETLLRKADEAIYARRAAAVEEERKIKEKELSTETSLEERRQQLINLQGENARQEAETRGRVMELEAESRSKSLELEATSRAKAIELESQARAKALEMELSAYRVLEPRTILALSLKELGQNLGKVGNLTVTSEFVAGLSNLLASLPATHGEGNG